MNDSDLETIIRNWNPEKDSISVLKDAFEKYGNVDMAFENPGLVEAIVHIPIAEEFEEIIENLGIGKRETVLTCDHDGFCLIVETMETLHVSEL